MPLQLVFPFLDGEALDMVSIHASAQEAKLSLAKVLDNRFLPVVCRRVQYVRESFRMKHRRFFSRNKSPLPAYQMRTTWDDGWQKID